MPGEPAAGGFGGLLDGESSGPSKIEEVDEKRVEERLGLPRLADADAEVAKD